MLLENKTAIVYGAGGSIGGAIVRAFAAEGARCFLVGRTDTSLEQVASEVRGLGGQAETAVLDVLDEAAVADHADAVVSRAGAVDIAVNVTSQDATFTPLPDIAVEDFSRVLSTVVRSQMNTTKAVTGHMTKQGSGVVLFFGGSDNTYKQAGMGTVQVAMDVVESMRRQWAADVSPQGVRLVTLLSGGVPESFPDIPEMEPAKQALADATLLKRAATLSDVGEVAAFVASDRARTLTSTQVNISCGAHGD